MHKVSPLFLLIGFTGASEGGGHGVNVVNFTAD
jgi:hypothetical protein